MTAKKTPTAEQAAIIEAVKSGKHKVIVIKAGAGTGKTTLLRMLADILEEGQYTAFNKKLVDDSKDKFAGTKTACNTTHSLAFKSEGKRFSKRLNGRRVRSNEIAAMLGISHLELVVDLGGSDGPTQKNLSAGYLAGQVIQAVKRYCQSADKKIDAKHFKYIDGIDLPGGKAHNNAKVREYLLPFAQAAWKDLSNPKGTLPFSHDYYVKVWQLNRPSTDGSHLLLDEYQDTAPVMIDVLKQQKVLVILVGDDAQRIYEWRGAENAGDHFPDAPVFFLSQSFRFGEVIANIANMILSSFQVETTELRLKGLPTIPSKVEVLPDPDVILCRTNAVAVTSLLEALKQGKKPHLVGGGADVIAFVKAAKLLQEGKPTEHPDLACFSSWEEVQEYSKLDEGEDLQLMVKLVDTFKVDVILNALEGMANEANADLTICTAHKSKGMEWNKVKLANDFPNKAKSNDSDLRLLYVAVTRAKLVLDISSCPFFNGQDAMDVSGAIASAKIIEKTPEEKAAEEEAAKKVAEEKAAAQAAGSAPEFTWNKSGDKWCVRGPKGFAGKTVDVTKKAGGSQKKLLGKVVTEFATVCLYEV